MTRKQLGQEKSNVGRIGQKIIKDTKQTCSRWSNWLKALYIIFYMNKVSGQNSFNLLKIDESSKLLKYGQHLRTKKDHQLKKISFLDKRRPYASFDAEFSEFLLKFNDIDSSKILKSDKIIIEKRAKTRFYTLKRKFYEKLFKMKKEKITLQIIKQSLKNRHQNNKQLSMEESKTSFSSSVHFYSDQSALIQKNREKGENFSTGKRRNQNKYYQKSKKYEEDWPNFPIDFQDLMIYQCYKIIDKEDIPSKEIKENSLSKYGTENGEKILRRLKEIRMQYEINHYFTGSSDLLSLVLNKKINEPTEIENFLQQLEKMKKIYIKNHEITLKQTNTKKKSSTENNKTTGIASRTRGSAQPRK